MPTTFMQLVAEAREAVPATTVEELARDLEGPSAPLVIDVRDSEEIEASGMLPGAHAISVGTLLFRADEAMPDEVQHPALGDRSQPIVTQCQFGPLGAVAARQLRDYGFTDVRFLEGGIAAWQADGHPTVPFAGRT